MKIGILTLPLHVNYGGILQCYALQTVLKRMGHDVTLLSSTWASDKDMLKLRIKNSWKHVANILFGYNYTYIPTKREERILRQHISKFIANHLEPRTKPLHTTKEYQEQCLNDGFDALIVGSDQVWRPRYTPSVTDYYLKFVENEKTIKRIAYAASFGTDEWEYSKEETEECRQLIKKFDAVSVREHGGVYLCKEHYDIEAVQTLDPTMLLECADYKSLVALEKEEKCSGTLFSYILDPTDEKQELAEKLSTSLSLVPFGCIPTKSKRVRANVRKCIDECTYPPVTQWIRSFMDAEMVITDSFHGCVFSILFNKPFWVIGNEGRGISRFSSLLATFGLQDRMIMPGESPEWNKKIDWDKVNEIRQREKERSIQFLYSSLSRYHTTRIIDKIFPCL